ncbi:MAG: L-2-amino-thiazoline-4-carboxylic acid hydrolase [Treponema sp.]|jgi:hypothetical protein|nr:L-2-amino-thiazoline-4-carboxylic acid hydrolase [Treponema sp.]
MLKIKKSNQSAEIEAMRRLIKDRGRYLYFLLNAAKEQCPDWESFARRGLTEYGCMRYRESFAGIRGLEDFAAAYLSESTKKIFDSDIIEKDDNHLVIKAGYCPLMHAWVECGAGDEYVNTLCDIAMDGDRAMVNSIPALKFSLRKSLAAGDSQCEFLVKLNNDDKEQQ